MQSFTLLKLDTREKCVENFFLAYDEFAIKLGKNFARSVRHFLGNFGQRKVKTGRSQMLIRESLVFRTDGSPSTPVPMSHESFVRTTSYCLNAAAAIQDDQALSLRLDPLDMCEEHAATLRCSPQQEPLPTKTDGCHI